MIANYSLRRPRSVDCLALKGGAGRWAILRFGAPVEAADPQTLPPACFLRSDVDALTAALNAPQERFRFADVVPGLLRAVTQASGSRNLLLLADHMDGSALPELCGKLYSSLLHPYGILYYPEPARSLKLQVYSEQGCNEGTLEG